MEEVSENVPGVDVKPGAVSENVPVPVTAMLGTRIAGLGPKAEMPVITNESTSPAMFVVVNNVVPLALLLKLKLPNVARCPMNEEKEGLVARTTPGLMKVMLVELKVSVPPTPMLPEIGTASANGADPIRTAPTESIFVKNFI